MNTLTPTIQIGSDILVTDPCYIPDSLDGGAHSGGQPSYVVKDALSGEWRCAVETDDRNEGRVSVVSLTHVDNDGFGLFRKTERVEAQVFVDSGQMSLMDVFYLDEFMDDDGGQPFKPDAHVGEFTYQGACQLTLSEAQGGVLCGKMLVSSSGYGDGQYPVYVTRDGDGRAVQVEVRFMENSEEEGW